MRDIGGYLELELPSGSKEFLHSEGMLVNSGRHALELILRSLSPKPQKVLLPFFTCEVVLQPIQKLNIPYEFYHIDERLELVDIPKLCENEYIIVNNYFGIKDLYIEYLSSVYKNKIIIDQAQAWYASEYGGVKAFYSPRKFFGIPDGGVAFGIDSFTSLERDQSWDRCTHLLKRHDLSASEGYNNFRENSRIISESPLKSMSCLTYNLLSGIDMNKIKEKRRDNFHILNEALESFNEFIIPTASSFECPMVYPFFTFNKGLRQFLINNKIFVATYWTNVKKWCKQNSVENSLTDFLLPLPIDQRYGKSEMELIINYIYNYMNSNGLKIRRG